MIGKARAKFYGGALHPMEPLDLAESQEVLVSIQAVPPQIPEDGAGLTEPAAVLPEQARKALQATAGAWKDSSSGSELKRNIYADRLANSRPENRP